jgi:hypothetical protein
MARPLRIEYPGAVYHTAGRGNARHEIYRDDGDREAFLKIRSPASRRIGLVLEPTEKEATP